MLEALQLQNFFSVNELISYDSVKGREQHLDLSTCCLLLKHDMAAKKNFAYVFAEEGELPILYNTSLYDYKSVVYQRVEPNQQNEMIRDYSEYRAKMITTLSTSNVHLNSLRAERRIFERKLQLSHAKEEQIETCPFSTNNSLLKSFQQVIKRANTNIRRLYTFCVVFNLNSEDKADFISILKDAMAALDSCIKVCNSYDINHPGNAVIANRILQALEDIKTSLRRLHQYIWRYIMAKTE
ncbi:hypothetical protein Bhyg_10845 [Pseudolycoriella hygida]|uniref:Uncharacterized protein n=1 Tax=Pseudolycoriella hygida TaxID=35572 RepID=A0A9Q0MWX1_9DIPT|nr:hypothetical protein Bhyg_10845 [Pseudolycoriella hygida]